MKNFISLDIDFSKKICIVGIGNELMSDDGAGPFVIKSLQSEKVKDNISLINASLAPENYLGRIIRLNPEIVVFVDAKKSGNSEPGQIGVVGMNELGEDFVSTHGMSVKMLAETISSETGADIYIIGIEARKGALAGGFSQEVRKNLGNIIEYFKEGICTN